MFLLRTVRKNVSTQIRMKNNIKSFVIKEIIGTLYTKNCRDLILKAKPFKIKETGKYKEENKNEKIKDIGLEF